MGCGKRLKPHGARTGETHLHTLGRRPQPTWVIAMKIASSQVPTSALSNPRRGGFETRPWPRALALTRPGPLPSFPLQRPIFITSCGLNKAMSIPSSFTIIPNPFNVILSEAEGPEPSVLQPLQSSPTASSHPNPVVPGKQRHPALSPFRNPTPSPSSPRTPMRGRDPVVPRAAPELPPHNLQA